MRISSKIGGKKVSKPCFLMLVAVFVTGCINNPDFAPLGSSGTQVGTSKSSREKVHIVQPGDTLYSIALRYDLDHRRLAAANNVDSSYIIYPGQRLLLDVTKTSLTSGARETPNTPSNSSTTSTNGSQQATVRQNNDSQSIPQSPPPGPAVRWVWPYDGKIVRTFQSDQSLSKGVDIEGQFGEPVRAAADGKIVFAGSGLRGYGNLIIIEHNPIFLSAYAHTSKMLVQENQTVKAGQQIAEIGMSGSSNQPLLHFEIRREGKPVNPVSYLPNK